MAFRRLVLLLAVVIGWSGGAVRSQETLSLQSPVLIVDFERLFAESEFGLSLASELTDKARIIAAENRKIEAELIAQEKRIADLRPTIEHSDFRKLADDFDAKVQAFRKSQDAKAEALSKSSETARARFLVLAQPPLEEIMRETGAAVILERGSVFMSISAVDITFVAIARINAVNELPTEQKADE